MEELARIRVERGWSQQRLADESGVNKATINQIERGRRSPNLETLEKLAEALEVEMADFFPKTEPQLPLHNRVAGGDLGIWTAYLTHLAEHFEDLADEEAEPCRRYGRGDVAPGVAGDALTAVEALLDTVRKGTVVATAADIRSALRAGFRLAKAADRIDELAAPNEEDVMRGARERQDRILTEIRFRKIVEDLELTERAREEIFA